MSDWSANPGRRPQQGGYDYYRGARNRQGGAAPPQPPRPPEGGRPAGPPPPRRKRANWPRRIGITLLVLVLIVVGFGIYVDSVLQRTPALDYPNRIADTPGTNWLLVGSDSREGLDESQREELSAGDAAGRRTDSMMLVHIPSGGGKPALISLPRDSYVSIPGHGKDKLNAAFSEGGPKLLAQTVETATDVHIDHYAEIGFGGFSELVDAVGGVDMNLEKPMDDEKANAHLPAGPQELNGAQALAFVRARYSLSGGDLERAENQRKLLGALVDKAMGPGTLLNPFRLVPLANAAGTTFLLDEGGHVWHLFWLTKALGDVSSGEGITTSVPFGDFGRSSSGQSVIKWDSEDASRMFEAIAKSEPIPPDLIEK
ncbi:MULTISPECIES: LCP family protein [unclassified Saccharopolyspora]|uniref:LCP family protein n=1 Tax=Saccharopolyspora TaxID=1835 RepID=UPI0019093F06|nr:LCP family protein [Saccharopolyspora sp. HNM0986]MBK0869808.1 LCP family protein [Saccharopolyspora sp. HNM0986]